MAHKLCFQYEFSSNQSYNSSHLSFVLYQTYLGLTKFKEKYTNIYNIKQERSQNIFHI